ncbi:FkbM family methyltransferase [Bradyrhizobium lablabi]|uniref:FkbM family methyltransferase n=1 Tax=Bradyrhizobium lablabi TaxID=722472 RepID=UPI001BA4496E|nr:FkbM family methyltransferase [Bradyrhizobium lablabi]MBR0693200.1 FkbM family methyltransferase [Bradyrhizobium lablabi]
MNSYYETAHFLVRCARYRLHTERLQLKTLMSLNLAGATAIDIGANKGIYCFWLSRAVGPNGRVLAFEPQPEMVAYIEERKRHIGCANVSIVNLALSNRSGPVCLARERVGDGSASLQTERWREGAESIQVEAAPLDDIEKGSPSFIKCDVEGHELSVFEGARRTIETFRPVVQFESTAVEATALFRFFESLGYSGLMYLSNRYAAYADVKDISHPKFGLGEHRDFLFFPQEAIGTIVPDHLARTFSS